MENAINLETKDFKKDDKKNPLVRRHANAKSPAFSIGYQTYKYVLSNAYPELLLKIVKFNT